MSILHFYHSSHTPFLHARGELGSECMLGVLNLQGNESVLDFGCGTGSTLAKIISRVPTCHLYGYDNNLVAIQKTKARLRFCGITNRVTLIQNLDELILKPGIFDVIYVESVLAILPKRELNESLNQIRDLLKPGGRLVCNETIWVENILDGEKCRINQICENIFGIPQCSMIFSDLQNAISMIEKSGFCLLSAVRLDEVSMRAPKRNSIEYRSTCYSALGKLISYLRRDLLQHRRLLQKMSSVIFSNEKKYLSGQLLEFNRPKGAKM